MRTLQTLFLSMSAVAALAISSNALACGGEEKPKDEGKKPSVLCGGDEGKPKDEGKKPSMLCGGDEGKPKDDGKKKPSLL